MLPRKSRPERCRKFTFVDRDPKSGVRCGAPPCRSRPTPTRLEGEQEVLELTVKNTGPMTALFCEPHPLIEYRTDLFIDNNHCFIPPGESRTITIQPIRVAGEGQGMADLTLAQTGWRLSMLERRRRGDRTRPRTCCSPWVGAITMCRDFAGYFDSGKVAADTGCRSRNPSRCVARPLLARLANGGVTRWEFQLSKDTGRNSRPVLRIAHRRPSGRIANAGDSDHQRPPAGRRASEGPRDPADRSGAFGIPGHD